MNPMIQQTFAYIPKYHNGPFILTRKNNTSFPPFPHSGNWNDEEMVKYFLFLEEFQYFFLRHQLKKIIFEQLSYWIKTRNYRQCRNYHKKMLDTFATLPKLIEYLKKDIAKRYSFEVDLVQQLDTIKDSIRKKLQPQNQQINLFNTEVFTLIEDQNQSKNKSSCIFQQTQKTYHLKDLQSTEGTKTGYTYMKNQDIEPIRKGLSSLYDRIYKTNPKLPPKHNWSKNIYLSNQLQNNEAELHVPSSQQQYENFLNVKASNELIFIYTNFFNNFFI